MTGARTYKAVVVALIALFVATMGFAPAAGADDDQCAPPGVDSASALPTNLASAAKGPEADKYTTARRRTADRRRTPTPSASALRAC